MSTKEFGCFFCNGKSSDYGGLCCQCGQPVDVSAELLRQKIDGYTPVEVLGRGYYGWTLRAQGIFEQQFAIKIVPRHRFTADPVEEAEARALVACSVPPHRNLARFAGYFKAEVAAFGQRVPVICLVLDYIEGARTLRQIIEDRHLRLSKSDVVAILVGIGSGLSRLHSKGLWHHDLHDDNILVRPVGADENLDARFESKLIDFGSVKPFSEIMPEHQGRSDYYYLGKHIYGLSASFQYGTSNSLTPIDRTFVSRLLVLGQRLSDPDVSRRNMTPTGVVQEIRNALADTTTGYEFPSFQEMLDQSRISLNEPLANTNAINLAPRDIARLFCDILGWTTRIERSEPVIVTGPRGCGKTMLLRFLSVESQAWPIRNENSPRDVARRLDSGKHIGFLVRGGKLRTPFIRSGYKRLEESDKRVAEDFCREYISANFAFEVVRTMLWLHVEQLASISADDLEPLTATGFDLLDMQGELYKGVRAAARLCELLEQRVTLLSNLAAPEAYQPTQLCRDDILIRLAQTVRAMSWARSKEVWFLLDDYSPTLLPVLAQQAYNPVLFRLSTDLRIKISSEGDGPILDDTMDRKYREGRELTKVNLGAVYFENREDHGRRFFEDILDARFRETEKGSLQQLKDMLKEHDHEENFGKYILSVIRPGDARFYGFGLLCRLCSGDVSYIIELLHAITTGRWDSPEKWPSVADQDSTTKRFAQRQLADLKRVSEFGPRLHEFAERVGNLLKQYLLNSKGKKTANETLRIQIQGPGELSPDAQRMHDALLRHSVLIAGGYGKAPDGTPARRLFFRRLFAPCFPFSPSRTGCISLRMEEYEKWLLDPRAVWDKPPEKGLFSDDDL